MNYAPLIFYMFAFFLLLGAVGVVSFKSPVHSILCLVFCFFNAAGLFVLVGAEFLAMILVIVYVGAVAVLFLFVVMMLRVEQEGGVKKRILPYLPFIVVFGVTLFTEMMIFLTARFSLPSVEVLPGPISGSSLANTQEIANLLYGKYFLAFEVLGLLLFVAMVGAILLTHRRRKDVRRQNISSQVAVRSKDRLRMHNVPLGGGMNDLDN